MVHGPQSGRAHRDGLRRVELGNVATERFDQLVAKGRLTGRDEDGAADGLGDWGGWQLG